MVCAGKKQSRLSPGRRSRSEAVLGSDRNRDGRRARIRVSERRPIRSVTERNHALEDRANRRRSAAAASAGNLPRAVAAEIPDRPAARTGAATGTGSRPEWAPGRATAARTTGRAESAPGTWRWTATTGETTAGIPRWWSSDPAAWPAPGGTTTRRTAAASGRGKICGETDGDRDRANRRRRVELKANEAPVRQVDLDHAGGRELIRQDEVLVAADLTERNGHYVRGDRPRREAEELTGHARGRAADGRRPPEQIKPVPRERSVLGRGVRILTTLESPPKVNSLAERGLKVGERPVVTDHPQGHHPEGSIVGSRSKEGHVISPGYATLNRQSAINAA